MCHLLSNLQGIVSSQIILMQCSQSVVVVTSEVCGGVLYFNWHIAVAIASLAIYGGAI
jgi:hypothetical protein